MDIAKKVELLLAFFKALSDESRLRIVGLLLQKPHTVEELSAALNLSAPTVSHHLKQLAGVDLVSAVADGHYHVYSLQTDTLREMAGALLDSKVLAEGARQAEPKDLEAKVLKDFMVDGRIKTIPSQRKKREVLLRHLVTFFSNERTYSEKEINEILSRFHEDVATLRREFIGYGLMERKNGHYRRLEESH